MTALATPEITPGLVVRLDTAVLRSIGGSESNAETTATEDRSVTGSADFLVVAVDEVRRRCTLVPLFARSSPGSAELYADKRTGEVAGWTTEPVHYSRWQHWRIPHDALALASEEDPGEPGARRGFAIGNTTLLQEILNWAARNRCAFRAL